MLVPGVVALIVLAVDGSSYLVRWVMRPERGLLILGFSLAFPAWALWAADEPFMGELRMETSAYMVSWNHFTVEAGIELSRYADPRGSVAVAAAGTVPYYSGLRGVDVLGKSDRYVARLRGHGSVNLGHNKYDLRYSIEKLRPDVIFDALRWARYERNNIFEFVNRNYVQRGSFWLRRDSPYIRWDRLPPQ
jgi:hypothetical protein